MVTVERPTGIDDPDRLFEEEPVNDAADHIAAKHGDIAWEIGDELTALGSIYGEGTIKGFTEALADRGVDLGVRTVESYKTVAMRFHPESRFGTPLTWSHHLAVGARPDRIELLKLALDRHLSVAQLRTHVADLQAKDEVRAEGKKQRKEKVEPKSLDELEDLITVPRGWRTRKARIVAKLIVRSGRTEEVDKELDATIRYLADIRKVLAPALHKEPKAPRRSAENA